MASYEKYRQILSQEDFYSDWSNENLESLTEELKTRIYERYIVKCTCFQRDNFKCQNSGCKKVLELTLHHVKWQKNDGEHKLKNCVTLCKKCHQGYHNGSNDLTFWNQTFKLHLEPKIDWALIRSWAREVRKNNKEFHGLGIDWELLIILIKFLSIPYDEMENDE